MSRFLLCPILAVGGLLPSASAVLADGATPPPVYAEFEGRKVDLSKGWGAAQACIELNGSLECFRSEAAMDRAHPEVQLSMSATEASVLGTCSTSLRLYDGANYASPMIALTTTSTVLNLNLSSYAFDNKTSSFRVGACAARLYQETNAGGGLLSAAANSSVPTLSTSWNNAISSVVLG